MSKVVNMHEAKTHLSRLADEVNETGESFIIAKAGKPWVQVSMVPAKKLVIGARKHEYAAVDTDEWDKLDAEIALMFLDGKLERESANAARH